MINSKNYALEKRIAYLEKKLNVKNEANVDAFTRTSLYEIIRNNSRNENVRLLEEFMGVLDDNQIANLADKCVQLMNSDQLSELRWHYKI